MNDKKFRRLALDASSHGIDSDAAVALYRLLHRWHGRVRFPLFSGTQVSNTIMMPDPVWGFRIDPYSGLPWGIVLPEGAGLIGDGELLRVAFNCFPAIIGHELESTEMERRLVDLMRARFLVLRVLVPDTPSPNTEPEVIGQFSPTDRPGIYAFTQDQHWPENPASLIALDFCGLLPPVSEGFSIEARFELIQADAGARTPTR